MRLALALPLQVQWVASSGWLDLSVQGFPAGLTGVYQWRVSCPLLWVHTKGNTHTLGLYITCALLTARTAIAYNNLFRRLQNA